MLRNLTKFLTTTKKLFHRDPDDDVLSYWTLQINLGVIQLAEVGHYLIYEVNNRGSGDGGVEETSSDLTSSDLKSLTNKTNAAVAYTEEIRKTTERKDAYVVESVEPFVAGKAFTEAKNYMDGIDKDIQHTDAGIIASIRSI